MPAQIEKLLIEGKNKVLIVAHPDDESLFFGGVVLRYPGNWTILACSIPYNETVRAWKFFDAVDVLGAKGRLLPWAEKRNEPIAYLDQVWHVMNAADCIVTHSASGEYGHPAHLHLHKFVASRWSDRGVVGCYGHVDGKLRLELTDQEHRKKLEALRCYDMIDIYRGKSMPAWETLLKQYGPDSPNKFNSMVETYTNI